MRFAEVAEASDAVAASGGRLAKAERLAAVLARATPAEVPVVVGMLSGRPRQGRIGAGPALLRDLPPAAAVDQAAAPLEVMEVDAALSRFATLAGAGSSAERASLIAGLFARAGAAEQSFLARLLVGELRQGALEGLMIDAIAKASGQPGAAVRRAFTAAGDLGRVAAAALGEGRAGLDALSVQPFRPLKPMLAQPAADVAEALARLGTAAFDYKLDGVRIQAHKSGGEVRVYSRRLNEVTAAVPEIVAAVAALEADALILDGEALAFQPSGLPQPFQVTMSRFAERADVDARRAELPLEPFFFDCLLCGDERLTAEPAERRFATLARIVPERLRVARIVTAEPGVAEAFFDRALAAGHEGLMAKALDSHYEAGARGLGWFKIKRAATLDLVVLAAEWGHGRRHGWLSNLHLGARDPASGGFVMLGKTFKGMTDAMLAWQTQALQAIETARDAWTVHVRPQLVVEVAFNGIQASPHYPGGMALRFARVKGYRPDKRPEEADTIDTVRALFERERTGGD